MAQPIPFPRADPADSRRRRRPLEVRPPALWPRATPVWLSITRWLRDRGRSTEGSLPLRDRLGRARADFVAALADVPGDPSSDLQTRVRHARSLRELWHLRTELFSLVARRFSQAEAQRRLRGLNGHFPVHASRTGDSRMA